MQILRSFSNDKKYIYINTISIEGYLITLIKSRITPTHFIILYEKGSMGMCLIYSVLPVLEEGFKLKNLYAPQFIWKIKFRDLPVAG